MSLTLIWSEKTRLPGTRGGEEGGEVPGGLMSQFAGSLGWTIWTLKPMYYCCSISFQACSLNSGCYVD